MTHECRFCGQDHVLCPSVAEIEYYDNGVLKRVVFSKGGENFFKGPVVAAPARPVDFLSGMGWDHPRDWYGVAALGCPTVVRMT